VRLLTDLEAFFTERRRYRPLSQGLPARNMSDPA